MSSNGSGTRPRRAGCSTGWPVALALSWATATGCDGSVPRRDSGPAAFDARAPDGRVGHDAASDVRGAVDSVSTDLVTTDSVTADSPDVGLPAEECLLEPAPTDIERPVPDLPERPGVIDALDPQACETGRWFWWLPLGSAWIIARSTGEACEVWLGGETENPLYDGSPTQYCRLAPKPCAIHVNYGQGGPAWIDSSACTAAR